ncbi:hypothetical protein [Marinovum algicola]|uniref:hypothetical protein n=1 Tax=Marinovum algicola TaxID=42444 RepID=UPI003B522414
MTAQLRAIPEADLPEYPLDAGERLDSHSFIPWEFRRWMSSEMRWNGSHECKSLWFELVNYAHSETPVGTLPNDIRRLARMVQPAVDPTHFEELCKLQFGPLHGWRLCRCGEDIRLMHDTVVRVVLGAFASRANHAARVEAASQQAKLRRLTQDVAQLAPKLASDPRKVRWVNTWIEEAVTARGGERRTPAELHSAIQACLAEERKGRWAASG